MFFRAITRLVDGAGRRPYLVLALTLLFSAASWLYARKLELRSDFLELLPRDSPGFMAYEHQLGRVGGGASFNFVVESPDPLANRRFIDALKDKLLERKAAAESCAAACADDACREACPKNYVMYLEAGTREVHDFFEHAKWLYASLEDLEEADRSLDEQIAFQSGLVADLGEPKAEEPASAGDGAAAPGEAKPKKKSALGLDEQHDRWEKSSKKYDDFPTGYFESADGTRAVLRAITSASGTGGASGDVFTGQMTDLVKELAPASFHPAMQVGYAGDIPNAKEEKESIMSEALWAAIAASLLSLAGIVVYFRSLWALVIVFVPVFIGVGAAYAFATATFGYVNTAGAFLGAIIVGNGINYPIVLFARYREFRARGMSGEEARREAVLNAFRAELVGAAVAGIAYGSLTVTRFRGFSQFGAIGFFGMLLVWVSIIPVVPALIVAIENLQPKLPSFLRDRESGVREDGTRGPFVRVLAAVTERHAKVLVVLGVLLSVAAAAKIPGYLADPWEYSFHKLGSKSTKQTGAGIWSNKCDAVFEGKQDISGVRMLADSPEQVPLLKEKIFANDAADPEGRLIEKLVTIQDFLPGTRAEQEAKLEVIERMLDRLSPGVLSRLSESERKRVDEMRPPADLHVIEGKDLPALLRRRFEENDGRIGTLFYAQYKPSVSQGNGRLALRLAKTMDNITLDDGTLVRTASRASVYAAMIESMRRDGPLATGASFLAVVLVVLVATHNLRGAVAVLSALVMGVVLTLGWAGFDDLRLNFLNFIALPITFGIGCEYPFNIYDRSRILKGDVTAAVKRSGGAVMLCSYTTIIGYGSLLVSDQQAVASFGRLAVVGEIACVAMAVAFLPALLHLLGAVYAPTDHEAH
jgi:uncharacterized protein